MKGVSAWELGSLQRSDPRLASNGEVGIDLESLVDPMLEGGAILL